MRATITVDLLKKATPKDKPFEIWDDKLSGFLLRVQPSGVMTYWCEYARHKRIRIASADVLSPALARDEAKKRISEYVHGDDPGDKRKRARAQTLKSFVDEHYQPWVEAHLGRPAEAIRRVNLFMDALGNKKLPDIDAWAIEKWRSARLKDVTAMTCNHDLDVLRAALNKAVEWRMLDAHPMRTVKRSKVDTTGVVRYLNDDEDKRLRAALDAREARRRVDRDKFNQWRAERGYKLFPQFGAFTDHLKPIVLLALNTGMRRGELFNLKWADVNFAGRMVTVVGKTAKSGKTRHLPLNDEAFGVLSQWYGQRKQSELVFPSYDGERMDNISTSWERLMRDAKVEAFRFHDCRHDFASKLVMAGVDLNTVRELLGHSDIKMTLRYAHLAPKKLAAAVAVLGQRS